MQFVSASYRILCKPSASDICAFPPNQTTVEHRWLAVCDFGVAKGWQGSLCWTWECAFGVSCDLCVSFWVSEGDHLSLNPSGASQVLTHFLFSLECLPCLHPAYFVCMCVNGYLFKIGEGSSFGSRFWFTKVSTWLLALSVCFKMVVLMSYLINKDFYLQSTCLGSCIESSCVSFLLLFVWHSLLMVGQEGGLVFLNWFLVALGQQLGKPLCHIKTKGWELGFEFM